MIFISTVLFVALILFISALTFGILFALWFIVVPYLLVNYYLQQGGEGYFKPFMGFFQDRLLEVKLDGDFLSYFKKMRSHQRFVVSNLGNKAVVFLTDTDLIKEFVNQPQDYCKARIGTGMEAFFESQGILFSEAEQWKRQRRLLAASFNNEFLKEQTMLMSAFVEKAYCDEGILKDSANVTNISQLCKKVSGDILGRAFFGPVYQKYTFEEQPMTLGMQNLLADAFEQAYSMWNILLGHLFSAGILPQHRKLVNRIQDLRTSLLFIVQDIKRRNCLDDQSNCLLKNLLEQQKQTPENAMTDQEIVDNFISLFIAGANPTGNLVSAVLYTLTQHPEIHEKVTDEIDEKLTNASVLNFEQTQKMEFLLAVIKESLRQNNPQGVLTYREAIQDHQLQDLTIKKGTLVTFSPLVSCFDEKFFVRSFEFRPERWLLDKNKNLALKKQPFGFIPFSAGPKACLGQHFALIQTKVMLIGFLKKFQMNFIKNGDILKMTHRETYEPLEDIKMMITPRERRRYGEDVRR